MNRVEVALGIVVREGLVLICQRRPGGVLGGLWEFPGGKVEWGETPRACVQRELKEEVALEVHPVEALEVIDYDYPTVRVRLHPFICEWRGGEAMALACQGARWVRAAALEEYPFPPANASLLKQVAAWMGG